MAVIAGWKIDEVSRIMTEDKFSKAIEDKKKEITKYIEDRFRSDVFSEEVIKMFDANRERMKIHSGISVKIKNENSLFYSYMGNVPSPVTEFEKGANELLEDQLKNFPPLTYERLFFELKDLKKQKVEFKGKCKCVLASLKTYNKIKNDFPEAYEVLITQVDKEPLPSKDTCSDVEELRATLNS